MRHLFAASALAAVSFVTLQAQAADGPEQAFMAACEMDSKGSPTANADVRGQIPVVNAIKEATGKTACPMAWTAAKELTKLDASGKGITDIGILMGLSKLTNVNLSNNEITDVTPLGNLAGLKKLDLSGNKITDVSALGKATALTDLNLAKNQISDISGLSTLTALAELRVNDNQIDKVWAVTDMKALKKAYLSSNKIENLAPLAKNKKLVELAVRNNPVKNCPDKGKVEIKGKEIDNTDVLKGVCKDEAWKKGN